MARPPKDASGTTTAKTYRMTPAALGVIESARLPGESDAAVVNRLLTASGVDRARAVHPAARPAPVQQTLGDGCVHKDFHKLSFGWKCDDCGAVSRDFGKHWIGVPTGGGG